MNTPGDKKMLHVTQVDVTMFAQSLRTQGTPWAAGCADILESLWQECEDSRYADIEHEQLGCHVAKTGIYAVSARNAIIEECAQVCEGQRTHHPHRDNQRQDAELTIAAQKIRALSDGESQ